MTKLYVSEFSGLAATDQSDSVGAFPAATKDQVVDFSGGAASSAAFVSTTIFIEFEADSICSFLVQPAGGGPAAAVTNMRMAAGDRLVRRVSPGDKISAITNT